MVVPAVPPPPPAMSAERPRRRSHTLIAETQEIALEELREALKIGTVLVLRD
jgi:hypothetical protein